MLTRWLGQRGNRARARTRARIQFLNHDVYTIKIKIYQILILIVYSYLLEGVLPNLLIGFFEYFTGQVVNKADTPNWNFDVEITIDALDNIGNYDCFVLASGDGDFVKLVKYLKGMRKKAVIIAPSERLSWNLEKAANQVIYLDDLEDHIRL